MHYVSRILHTVLLVCLFPKGWTTNSPPLFTQDMNANVLSESTPVGQLVYTLKGLDPENGRLRYGLKGTDLFHVNPDTGDVTLVKPLDHEINDTLNFLVTLEDEAEIPGGKGNLIEVPITVIVLDENDNPPLFENVPYLVEVKEDALVGVTVFSEISATDYDTVGNSLEVECIDLPNFSGACEIFQLNPLESAQNMYRGSLVLKKPLNYTIREEYKFLLKAMDGDLNGTTIVTVKVLDVQNTPPAFVGASSAEVSEDAPIGTVVLAVHAEDGDRGSPRRIMYELIKDPTNYFLIDPFTGEIRTARPLDKEAINNVDGIVKLIVLAKEVVNGNKLDDPMTETRAEITIRITDINDEPPTFNSKEYHAEISEDVEIGYIIPNLNMTVYDPDMGNNSVFTLSLEDISHVFSIEPKIVNGISQVTIKVVNNSLDYEDLNQRKFIVLVIARELYTNPQLSSSATLTVTVTDANDNAPSFPLPTYSAQVSEVATAGIYVMTIVAKDRDSGKFGEDGLVYQLLGSDSDRFEVNNRTGVITVADCDTPGYGDCLDFETKQEYLLSYKVTDDDGRGQTTVVPLHITLTDSNDNPPTFNQMVYNVYIDEGAVKFNPDLIIQAKDLDKSSHITYSIISGNVDEVFNIDANTGKIRIASNKAIVYSQDPSKNNIMLTIEATDGKYTNSTIVNISILDINNNAPKFEQENYMVSVLEDATVGTSIVELKATDADSGLNAEVDYQILKGSLNDFIIDGSTGLISLASTLDYDRRNTYTLEVLASDRGLISLSSTATVTVHVLNTNNKSPYFVPPVQKAEVLKDAEVGHVVHTLVALDPDVNSSEALNFAATEPITALDKYGQVVENGAFKHFFSVNKHTGVVTVSNLLKRDIAAIIKISVLVTDTTAQSVQQGEGTLVITITDINDQPPVFMPPWTVQEPEYHIKLQEELPIGTIVTTLIATDDDSVIAGYEIVPENEYFTINSGTGIIQIKKRIDYEQVSQINFTVLAFDSGVPQLNTSARVYVSVININDNSPKFSVEIYNVSVPENSPEGTRIVTVNATDADKGKFGMVTYDLIGEHSQHFEISPLTGEIFIADPEFFDHELLNETTIQVTATDDAPVNLRHTVSVPIRVTILDVNDNPPIFNQTEYNVTVRENVPFNPPVPILQLAAIDLDEGANENLNYVIVSGNEGGEFLLGSDTGILYTHKSLLGKTNKFALEVEARDGKFAVKTTANIYVINSNQHKPRFLVPTACNSTIELAQHLATVGYSLITVRATDKDFGENGHITYHFKIKGEYFQRTEEFVLNENTGELKIRKFLDREIQDRYNLNLVAKDHGTPVWHEEICPLTLMLINTHKNIAEFPNSKNKDPYHFYISESSKKGTFIGQVKAYVSHTNSHAKIYYYILSGNENNVFHMNKLDGSLRTNKMFDREEKELYSLLVLASSEPDYYYNPKEMRSIVDNKTIFESSLARINVTVTDVNDNPPKFERSFYYAAINSKSNINKFVANVSAKDPDSGINASFTYYVSSSNLYKFESNVSSGSIIPSPFNVSQNGEIFTATNLTEYNQNRFIVDIMAKENVFPEREGFTNVQVWVFEPSQLIRIILSRPVVDVMREKDAIAAELSNATNYLIIIDDIKDHIDEKGHKNKQWCNMYILAVNTKTQTIVPVFDVLKIVDSKYDLLKGYYTGYAIQNVVPAFAIESEASFDPALSALIALLLVLMVGIVTFVIVCCCLRNWSVSGNSLKQKDALINKTVVDDLNTTENPLWIEQKLKIYEEQELTMQVFTEPDQGVLQRKSSRELLTDENAYATIQHPNRRGTSHVAALSLAGDDVEHYATLSRNPYQTTGSFNDSLRGTTNYYESALGFHGSTFQVPDSSSSEPNNESYGEYSPYHHASEHSTVGNEYVAELI